MTLHSGWRKKQLNGIEEVTIQLKTSGYFFFFRNVSPLVIIEGDKRAVATAWPTWPGKFSFTWKSLPVLHLLDTVFSGGHREKPRLGPWKTAASILCQTGGIQRGVKNGQISFSLCFCPNHLTIWVQEASSRWEVSQNAVRYLCT